MLEDCRIISNTRYKGDYFKLVFDSPRISPSCRPGQFVHVKIGGPADRMLRRPFSVNDACDGRIRILYKVVGDGTSFLSRLPPGTICNLMGPRGNGFGETSGRTPVIVAGGYGAAATFMLAKNSPKKGFLLAGARTSAELVLIEDYRRIGFDVMISTDDGSEGEKGLVTSLLDKFIRERRSCIGDFSFHACGPEPMLYAMARMLRSEGLDGEVSLDHMMCCGVGACLACVVRLRKQDGGWKYSRTCTDGPVFPASSLFLD